MSYTISEFRIYERNVIFYLYNIVAQGNHIKFKSDGTVYGRLGAL